MDDRSHRMAELFKGFFDSGLGVSGIAGFLFLITVSLICAFILSALYQYFYQNRDTGSQIHRAFPLLSLSITSIFICIQFSLPLSLGLLGALSIVRFRTPIKEPEEIGFIMVIVAVSIACATFNLSYAFLIIGMCIVGLSFQMWGPKFIRPGNRGTLLIATTEKTFEAKGKELVTLLGEELKGGKLDSVSTNSGKSVISYRFASLSANEPVSLEKRVKALLGKCDINLVFNA